MGTDAKSLDDIDRRILGQLIDDGRASLQALAEAVGLRRPSVHARVRRLERDGVIQGYHAAVDPTAVDADLVAFVLLTLDCGPSSDCMASSAAAADALRQVPEVLEYHTIAGEHDALVKVRARDVRDLERLTTKVVSGAPGVARIRTLIALSTAYERPVPVAAAPPPRRAATTRAARRR